MRRSLKVALLFVGGALFASALWGAGTAGALLTEQRLAARIKHSETVAAEARRKLDAYVEWTAECVVGREARLKGMAVPPPPDAWTPDKGLFRPL